jgi:A/G-specific adenine glycosylase
MRRFPDLDALAGAPIDEVLHAWAGLGYYRRARFLHAAARVVVREHGGRVPEDPDRFGALPGVGRYTTGAVLSICHDQPLPVLDGNVARVLSRLEALPLAVKRPADARTLWARAAALVPRRAPGDWNQALMELGAIVCTPRAPRCDVCPVGRWCRARLLGRVDEFPPTPDRPAIRHVRRAVALIERDGRLLMTRRRGALLDGLWEPPGIELAAGRAARPALARSLAALGVRALLVATGDTVRHAITHRRIVAEVWSGTLAAAAPRASRRMRWVSVIRPEVAVTALGTRLAKLSRASSGSARSRS